MAVTIVLFHAGVGWIWNIAVTGVTFFFISSTFLLAMRHPFTHLNASQYRQFVLSHAMRLYPLNWLGLALLVAIAILFNTGGLDWGATTLSALLLHSWFPAHDVHYGLNPVTWYLCALLFCYFIYPLIARLARQWRLRHKVAAAAVLAVILAVVLKPLDIPGREAVFVNPLSHVLDVVVGLVLLHICTMLKDRYSRVGYRTATAIEAVALLSLAAVITVNVTTTWLKPWEDVLIWLLPQGAILVALVWLNGQEGAIGRALLWKPLQWLGSISFEVYVLQFVAFHLFNYVISPTAGHFGWNIYGSLEWYVLPLLLPLSWLAHRYFTRPVGNYIHHLIKD